MSERQITREAILEILRRYNVRVHYLATKEGPGTRYAIWGSKGQITEPMSHRETIDARDHMIASDIVARLRMEQEANP